MFVFFFKQKTAYEMRISDWSSDVCSSDLWREPEPAPALLPISGHPEALARRPAGAISGQPRRDRHRPAAPRHPLRRGRLGIADIGRMGAGLGDLRSEEHTSELQSLMRISYAVFCLKKKQTHKKQKD